MRTVHDIDQELEMLRHKTRCLEREREKAPISSIQLPCVITPTYHITFAYTPTGVKIVMNKNNRTETIWLDTTSLDLLMGWLNTRSIS